MVPRTHLLWLDFDSQEPSLSTLGQDGFEGIPYTVRYFREQFLTI